MKNVNQICLNLRRPSFKSKYSYKGLLFYQKDLYRIWKSVFQLRTGRLAK